MARNKPIEPTQSSARYSVTPRRLRQGDALSGVDGVKISRLVAQAGRAVAKKGEPSGQKRDHRRAKDAEGRGREVIPEDFLVFGLRLRQLAHVGRTVGQWFISPAQECMHADAQHGRSRHDAGEEEEERNSGHTGELRRIGSARLAQHRGERRSRSQAGRAQKPKHRAPAQSEPRPNRAQLADGAEPVEKNASHEEQAGLDESVGQQIRQAWRQSPAAPGSRKRRASARHGKPWSRQAGV